LVRGSVFRARCYDEPGCLKKKPTFRALPFMDRVDFGWWRRLLVPFQGRTHAHPKMVQLEKVLSEEGKERLSG